MRRMLVIVNPHATGAPRELREAVVGILARAYEVRAVETQAQGHAATLAYEARRDGHEVIAAFGGDGTVNEVANGLAGHDADATDETSRGALACLPAGQANVFAKMIGAPANALAASEQLVAREATTPARSVDLGVVNGRCFTFSSGIGVDASVTRRVDANPRLKTRFGPWYYAWVMASTLTPRYLLSPPRMVVGVNGAPPNGSLRGVMAVVQNGSPYTFFRSRPIEVAEDGGLDSGSLAGCLLRRVALVDLPSLAFRALSPRASISAHPQVSPLTDVAEITVRSADERALPLHVDGDYLGEVTEARYSVMPDALRVLV
jgi:diacylglycerol kinase family enzyme